MSSRFGWFDFSESDRQRVAEAIALFRDRATRDELGLGVIRDTFSELLFPGTSTIQTRARYFLFVPWIYRRHEEKHTARGEVAKKARADEVKLIEALIAREGTAGAGVIGADARELLQRLPSSVYWSGLRRWGALAHFHDSQARYHRAFERFSSSDAPKAIEGDADPAESDVLPWTSAWDRALPRLPDGFPKEPISFVLTHDEAMYLSGLIARLKPPSLLAYLVGTAPMPAPDVPFAWEAEGVEGVSAEIRRELDHARHFSEVLHGAVLLYYVLLAEARAVEDWEETHRQNFEAWFERFESRRAAHEAWDLEEMFRIVEATGARLAGARRFVSRWVDFVRSAPSSEVLLAKQEARDLVVERERHLKGGRARLQNERQLELWNGDITANQLDYRWFRVRTIVRDIVSALDDGRA